MWSIEKQSQLYTTSLLNTVACRLSSITESFPSKSILIDIGENDLEISISAYEHFVALFRDYEGLQPNNTGRIFALIDFLITNYFACHQRSVETKEGESNDVWPCNLCYNYEVNTYRYYQLLLEMSVLLEKSSDSRQDFYYVCFSFPHQPEFYRVAELPTKPIPTFTLNSKDADQEYIVGVQKILNDIFINFCANVIEKKKMKSTEYSLFAICPRFSREISSTSSSSKKRKIDETFTLDQAQAAKKTIQIPLFYKKLRDRFDKLQPKPNDVSKLFALIHDLLTSHGCQTSLPKDEWPLKPEYQSQIISVWFKRSSSEEAVGKMLTVLNMSLLCNNREFFLVLRSTLEPSRVRVNKICKKLVPTFRVDDLAEEVERIENLQLWSSVLITKFIENVLQGLSPSASFMSVPSSSSFSQAEESPCETTT